LSEAKSGSDLAPHFAALNAGYRLPAGCVDDGNAGGFRYILAPWFDTGAIFSQLEHIFSPRPSWDRRSTALIGRIDALRAAFRTTCKAHPFTIDAIAILPDHLHVVMTLPPEDADYTNRWRLIKRRYTDAAVKSGAPVARHPNGE
jgi:glutathione S-transferase